MNINNPNPKSIGKKRKRMPLNIFQNIPEEVTVKATPTMKIERLVDKLHTYQKVGVQVIHIIGCMKRLEECKEFIALLSKEVSIFLSKPEECPQSLRKYIENA